MSGRGFSGCPEAPREGGGAPARLRTVRYLLGMARLGAEREAEAIGWARPR